MSLAPAASPSEQITAAGYQRAHAGKLMVIRRSDGRTPIASDFFHIESVGTHPTGLFVTGVFENDSPRAHDVDFGAGSGAVGDRVAADNKERRTSVMTIWRFVICE